MAAIKNLSEIARKFAEVTPQRAKEYGEGVERTQKDWANSTAAAEESYEQGVQQAISRKAFGKGVQDAGTAKYKEGVKSKGVARFAAGTRIAGAAYEKGFRPYHDVIAGVTLPPRGPRRDPRNLDRVTVMANALGQAKERMVG